MRRVGLGVVAWLFSTAALACAFAQAGGADAQGIHIFAQVDHTSVDLGARVTLTITIDGDVANATLEPVEFPKTFQVVAQRQATNVSFGAGALTRATSLVYVLAPQEAGTFQLGPFHLKHGGASVFTDPIQILVSKPALPPGLTEHQRYTL